MCIGIPMRVIKKGEGWADCEGFGERRRVNTLLVGNQAEGTWLYVFLESAREVLSEEAAERIGNGLRAAEKIMRGDMDVDHLFADLVDREPSRPGIQNSKR